MMITLDVSKKKCLNKDKNNETSTNCLPNDACTSLDHGIESMNNRVVDFILYGLILILIYQLDQYMRMN